MQDQPDLDMRYVYVGVHADGPTRVLCFSDRKDQYTQGTNEDTMAALSVKVARLESRLQVFSPRDCIVAPADWKAILPF